MARKTSAGRTHKAVAEEAGFKRLSLISVLAGTLTGYGAFAVLAAIIGAIFSAADVDTDFRTNDWASTEALGGAATAVTLLLAYLFGGYVAGRMARRSGVLHGVAVLVLGLLGGVIVGGLVAAVGDDQDVEQNLRSIGVPTTGDEWGNVGIGVAIVALVLMAVGAVLGGSLGERWHTKLARRAADPNFGPEAKARRELEKTEGERDRHIADDDLVRRDHDTLVEQSEAEAEAEREREAEKAREEDEKRQAEVEAERERELEQARKEEQADVDAHYRELDEARQAEQEREAERDREAQRARDAELERDAAIERDRHVIDVRSDDPDLAQASGTTDGAHASSPDDEPRYTAAEWAELQRSTDRS
jgi:hypothetical protein